MVNGGPGGSCALGGGLFADDEVGRRVHAGEWHRILSVNACLPRKA